MKSTEEIAREIVYRIVSERHAGIRYLLVSQFKAALDAERMSGMREELRAQIRKELNAELAQEPKTSEEKRHPEVSGQDAGAN